MKKKQKKKIAFICVHNSCRSQIAEALGRKYLSDIFECYSKLLDDIPEADIYVAMGCNVACPNIPGKKTVNWGLDDPTGQEDSVFLDVIRRIEENILQMRYGE